jgi:hypothetical protein
MKNMANFTKYLSGLFRPTQSDQEQYYEDDAVPGPAVSTSQYTDSDTHQQFPVRDESRTDQINLLPPDASQIQPAKVTIPYWLEDEDTLRDEGVLFGLSESDPTEKTDIIHKYFLHLATEPISTIEQQNERIQELNLFIGQKTNRIEELKTRLNENKAPKPDSAHHLPRTLTGLALCASMCIGNFFLIRESLKPVFTESTWIALGIFLAGMFNLFGRISIFHDTESKVSWRPLLEEVGLPFAAALFVFVNVYPSQSWLQASGLFVFIFFLFLFAGKLFLSNVTLLRTDLQTWMATLRDRKEFMADAASWEEEIITLQEEVDALRVKKWQALRDQSASETERDRINARRDMLIKLFESEFFLARLMKNQLTGKQLNYIQKGGQ